MDDWRLRNVWQNRQRIDTVTLLGQPLATLMKHRLAKRVKQIGRLSAIWDECIPQFIREHAALVGFARGVLTVAMDSAAHRYQFQMLLSSGLLEAMRERLSVPLDRVKVVPGGFDALEMPDTRPRGQA